MCYFIVKNILRITRNYNFHKSEVEQVDVKGAAVISIPIFILKKFGQADYEKWLGSLSPEARNVYSSPINKTVWFPLKMIMTEPTAKLCELFFNNSVRGAWECGRYSAEYSLKGVYKALIRLSSPQVIIKRAGSIMESYYRPSKMDVVDTGKAHVTVQITEFTEMDTYIENRIAGWMERALEICGCRNVTVTTTQSLVAFQQYTEFKIHWRKSL